MNRILLDTSAYSQLRRGHAEVINVVADAVEIYFSSVVVGELDTGFRGGNKLERNRGLLATFLNEGPVRFCNITIETSHCYSVICDDLIRRGRPLPTNDLWIAASAMELGLTVVTFDAHFREIPQIRTNVYARA
jgi:tRNA(fMet)-specific endonuclease VapC